MAEKDEKDGKETKDVRADADGGVSLEKVLTCMDSILTKMDGLSTRMDSFHTRMDSMEAEVKADKQAKADADKKADEDKAEEKKADADDKGEDKAEDKKADADDKDDDKKADEDKAEAKADAVALEAGFGAIRQEIKRVESMIPLALSDAEYGKMADAQARADRVYQAFGDAAPRPLQGETLLAYRRRLAGGLKSHSRDWKDTDLLAIADAAAFDVIEKKIYADALHAAHNPTDLPDGELRAIVSRDTTGRQITTFAGRPGAWLGGFSSNRRMLTGIGRKEH